MSPLRLEGEEMKAVPKRARHPMSNRAERRIVLDVVFKAVREDRHSDSLPSVKAFEYRTGGRQSRIPIRTITLTLHLAPEAARRSQSQISIVCQLGSTLACPLTQIPFRF